MLPAIVIDVQEADVAAFQAYELSVLGLLERHGGTLERRLRTADGTTEIHLLSFGGEEALRGYLQDPARDAARAALGGAELSSRVLRVSDVEGS